MSLRSRLPEPPRNMDEETKDYLHSLIRVLFSELDNVVKVDTLAYEMNEVLTDGTGIGKTYNSNSGTITVATSS